MRTTSVVEALQQQPPVLPPVDLGEQTRCHLQLNFGCLQQSTSNFGKRYIIGISVDLQYRYLPKFTMQEEHISAFVPEKLVADELVLIVWQIYLPYYLLTSITHLLVKCLIVIGLVKCPIVIDNDDCK